MCQECVHHVLYKYSACSQHSVNSMFIAYSQHILKIFIAYSQQLTSYAKHVHNTCLVCSQYMLSMFITYARHVLSIYSAYSQNIYSVCSVCSQQTCSTCSQQMLSISLACVQHANNIFKQLHKQFTLQHVQNCLTYVQGFMLVLSFLKKMFFGL